MQADRAKIRAFIGITQSFVAKRIGCNVRSIKAIENPESSYPVSEAMRERYEYFIDRTYERTIAFIKCLYGKELNKEIDIEIEKARADLKYPHSWAESVEGIMGILNGLK